MRSAVVCEALTKHFGSVHAVENLSFTVEPGEVVGFLGPNGAGKTTTVRLLLDLIRPTRGHVEVLGTTPRRGYPEGLLAFFGIEKGGLGTATGYLQAELFGLMLPLLLIAYAIAAGSAATDGERESGTLEFLLAQPVSRRRVLLEKLLGLCTSLLVITVSFAVVLVVSTRVFALDVAASHLIAATASAYLLAILFGAVAAYLLSSLAALVEGLKRFRPMSPFWWYSGHDPLRQGLEPLHLVLLVAATLVCIAAAVVVFESRDLA